MVWLRLLRELNGRNHGTFFEKAARNAMHPIHDLAICAEDHRVREISLVH